MRRLIDRYIPHAPGMGLYAHPNIPEDKLRNAIEDYAQGVSANEVLVLYDATLFGSAKDGALFTAEKIVFQNTDLHPAEEMYYDDIVGVTSKKRLLGGMKVLVDHNAGQATVTHTIDFSGKSGAAAYVTRFLHEAMLAKSLEEESADEEGGVVREAGSTDRTAVEAALSGLIAVGKLTRSDFNAMLDALDD